MTHLAALILFAALVSPAFACLMREGWAARLRFTLWAFLSFVGFAVGIGWVMYLAGG
ncbi:MAG: hypothetical protein OXE58_03080 [Acidobacteria bacterium]|nr:hypothetical protein [Acidobacteriota bacterium]